MRLWQKVVISVVVAEVLGSLGGIITSSSITDWYSTLVEPPGNPPNWVFGPVWALLYAMMAIAFAIIWHGGQAGPPKRRALLLFAIQFLLNLSWTPVFFGAHRIGLALIVILLLLTAILATIAAFRRINRTASWLLIPYLLWVAYATWLNAGYWYLNR